MIKQKILFFILFCICTCTIACKDEKKTAAENQGLLPVSTIHNPRTATDKEENLDDLGCLQFADSVHDFGTLQEGDVVEYEFEYTNIGKKEVLINDASSTCGCTVPEYSREPIAPKAKGVMKIKFNSAGKFGAVEKPISVYNNGKLGEIILHIQATVNK
jgi:Protein of unknown function (DUF1573)